MTAQETKLFNAFETTLTSTMGSSDTTFNVNAVADSYPTTLAAPFYIVINPDSATNREVVLVTAVDTGTKQLTTSVPNRYLPGSAASSGLSHSSGTAVRMAPLQQHIEDLNDRVDTIINEDGTAFSPATETTVDTTADKILFFDNSATALKQVTIGNLVDGLDDLTIIDDASNTIDIDLNTEQLGILGGTNVTTSGSGTALTISVSDESIQDIVGGMLTGTQTFITVSYDDPNGELDFVVPVLDEDDMSSDSATHMATQQSIKAYVDSNVTAQDLDITDGSTTSSVDLDSQTLTIQGTANKVDVGLTGQTFTVGLPSSITVNVEGDLTGNADTATTLATARDFSLTGDVAASAVSFDGSGNVELTTTIQANSVALGADTTGDYVATVVGGYGIDSTGGASGEGTAHTLDLDVSELTEVTAVSTDYVVIEDSTDNTTKKAPISDIISAGDITAIVTGTDSGLAGGVTSGAADLTLDANNLASTTAVTSDYLVIQDVTDNSTKKALISDIVDLGDITEVVAGSNLNGGGATGSVTVNLDTTITGLSSVTSTAFVGDLTGNADTATTLATSRNIAGQAFNGSADVTIAAGNLTDVSTSGVTDGQVLVYNNAASQFEPGSVGSATALIDGDSDFTLTDGIANGIHYELDNTDMADWNQAGIALTTAGGIFTHHQTQAATYTVAANTGSVMAGPITITGTVTNNGTLVVI